jgi:hypothetical protein
MTLAADSFVVTADKPPEIAVTIERQSGFRDEIEVAVEGLPEGLLVETVKSVEKTGTEKTVKLVAKLAEGATLPVQGSIKIVGRAGDKVRTARFDVKLRGVEEQTAAWITGK